MREEYKFIVENLPECNIGDIGDTGQYHPVHQIIRNFIRSPFVADNIML